MDRRLNYVVAVARSGSFTAAAEIVGVTQSAVTKSVADLEHHVGYSIFHRTSRGAMLTERGRDFVERAARLTEDTAELLRRAQGQEDAYAGILRIGVCPASLEWRLVTPLERLLARHPGIHLDIIGASFERMVQQVRNGAVDVAFGFEAAFAVWPDLHRETLASDEVRLFVRRGHPLLDRSGPSTADLAEFDLISPSDSKPYGEVIRNIYEGHGIEWQQRLHIIDYFPIAQRIVATTDAIGVVAMTHGQSAAFQTRFATLDTIDLFPQFPLCCALRATWEPKAAARAFVSTCLATMPPCATGMTSA